MHFKVGSFRSLFYFILLLGLVLPLKAQTEIELIKFNVRPMSCVVLKTGDTCRLIVKVEWEVSQAADVALLHDSEPLATWHNQHKGQKAIAVELKQTSQFHLQVNGDVLATQHVRLSSQESHQYRRRLHSDWSFF